MAVSIRAPSKITIDGKIYRVLVSHSGDGTDHEFQKRDYRNYRSYVRRRIIEGWVIIEKTISGQEIPKTNKHRVVLIAYGFKKGK